MYLIEPLHQVRTHDSQCSFESKLIYCIIYITPANSNCPSLRCTYETDQDFEAGRDKSIAQGTLEVDS